MLMQDSVLDLSMPIMDSDPVYMLNVYNIILSEVHRDIQEVNGLQTT